MSWLTLLKPGDWLLALLALACCMTAFPLAWQGGLGEKAIVRRGGEIFAELDLARNQRIAVPGSSTRSGGLTSRSVPVGTSAQSME